MEQAVDKIYKTLVFQGFLYLKLLWFCVKISLNMDIKEIAKKEDWDSFLLTQSGYFLQSWDWGEVLLSEQKKVTRLFVVEGDRIVAAAQIVETKLPFDLKYGFCAGGPVLRSDLNSQEISTVYQTLFTYARERGQVFLRVEPPLVPTGVAFKKIKDTNPSTTLILELSDSQEKYLAGLDKKVRYEIRRARSQTVKARPEKNLDIFFALLSQTAQHAKFAAHPKIHYAKILDNASSRQLIAYHESKPVASAIFWLWNDTLIYLFAASARLDGGQSAAYLIQENIIAWARQSGFKFYDFFGIAPNCHSDRAAQRAEESLNANTYTYDRAHRYAGFTKFKLGFGGKIVERPGTFDIIVSPTRYKIYNFQRRLRSVL